MRREPTAGEWERMPWYARQKWERRARTRHLPVPASVVEPITVKRLDLHEWEVSNGTSRAVLRSSNAARAFAARLVAAMT